MSIEQQIKEHAEVIGADGVFVGTVDRIVGESVKLTKKASGEEEQDSKVVAFG